ncbi:MAG: alanine racemase [Clostridium sp.]|nr:alanine racemase [Clostridium sp.]
MAWLKRTWATVSLDDLEHNYHQIRNQLSSNTKFMGVVKADAYGHGAIAISRALSEFGADYLAVANLDEGIQLRSAGIDLPILILGHTPPEFAKTLVQNKITQTVYSFDYACRLSYALLESNLRLKIHIKIDSGMSRIGFLASEEKSLREAIRVASLPGLEIEGIFTHFSSADSIRQDAISFTELQYNQFVDAIDYLHSSGIEFSLRHCCNSGGIAQYPHYSMDMVRSGIITYGIPASEEVCDCLDLRPIMTLQTIVAHIKKIPKGTPISYSRSYISDSERTIATLPIGYADGFPRALSSKVNVFIRGKAFPVIGRICMDMCMVDITGADIQVGDIVTVVGGSNAWGKMADLLGTIPYEVTCQIGKRVPRVYLLNGKEVDILNYLC